MSKTWKHRPECTETECYCADPEQPDPVCDCGCPGWACSEEWHREQAEWQELHDSYQGAGAQ